MKRLTFSAARQQILSTLKARGWDVHLRASTGRDLKVPYAISPRNGFRVDFKPEAVYDHHENLSLWTDIRTPDGLATILEKGADGERKANPVKKLSPKNWSYHTAPPAGVRREASEEESARAIASQERQAKMYQLADQIQREKGWPEWRAIEEAASRMGKMANPVSRDRYPRVVKRKVKVAQNLTEYRKKFRLELQRQGFSDIDPIHYGGDTYESHKAHVPIKKAVARFIDKVAKSEHQALDKHFRELEEAGYRMTPRKSNPAKRKSNPSDNAVRHFWISPQMGARARRFIQRTKLGGDQTLACQREARRWAKALLDAGFDVSLHGGFYQEGDTQSPDDLVGHAWLEVDGGIFDPTAGQFDSAPESWRYEDTEHALEGDELLAELSKPHARRGNPSKTSSKTKIRHVVALPLSSSREQRDVYLAQVKYGRRLSALKTKKKARATSDQYRDDDEIPF